MINHLVAVHRLTLVGTIGVALPTSRFVVKINCNDDKSKTAFGRSECSRGG